MSRGVYCHYYIDHPLLFQGGAGRGRGVRFEWGHLLKIARGFITISSRQCLLLFSLSCPMHNYTIYFQKNVTGRIFFRSFFAG